jgi:transcriptional regulator with XRE-family HTH domain
MKINDKIRFFRGLKGWSQEEMAEKLNMSLGGYSNIERGETNVQFSRLEQISKVLDVKLSDLTDLDETSFRIFLAGNNNVENQVTISSSDEQLRDKIEQQQKEIIYLKQEVNYLKEIMTFKERLKR